MIEPQKISQPSERSTNVRYASACRRAAQHSTSQKLLNECPIRFSLSLSCPTLNLTETAQRMSDTLQLVVELPNTQAHRTKSTGEEPGRCPIPTKLRVGHHNDKLKRIGHSLSTWKVELFL